MRQNDLIIRSAHLKTVDKLPDKLLAIGKIENEFLPNTFIFYLIEVNSPWLSSSKVKKAIVGAIDQSFARDIPIDDKFFEQKIFDINESLDKISRSGENSWIGNLNALVGFVYDTQLYLTQTGNISGYIFRDGKISTLAEGSRSHHAPLPAKTFAEVICGGVVPKDRIVFGNIDLYNHVSLDRLRKMTNNTSAKESNIELFRSLRKERIKSVNSLFIEVTTQTEEVDNVLNDIPEVLCLDEPSETFLSKAKKNIYPHLKESGGALGQHLSKFAKAFKFHSKNLYSSSQKKWQENYGPKTKELLHKSTPLVSKAFRKAKNSAHETTGTSDDKRQYNNLKVKTKMYSQAPASKLSGLLRTVFEMTKQFVNIILQKNNRKFVYLALIIVFLFAGYMKIRANNIYRDQKKQQTEIANAYDQAQELFDQAKEDSALGKADSSSSFESALKLATAAKENPSNREKAEVLMREIQNSIDKLNKTTRFYDLSKVFSFNDKTKTTTLVGTDFYSIDTDGKIYAANPSEKSARLLASIGTDKGQAVDLSYSESENKIFIYTNKNKLLAYDIKSKTHSEISISDGTGKWEDAKGLSSFTSNIYLLDSEAGEVWKHTKNDTGYGKGSAYLDTTKDSIRGSVDLAIDGNIYILQNDGSVIKFIKGTKDSEFSLKNIPKPGDQIEVPAKIYTDADMNYIYILDSKLNRILRFDKTGSFVNQYAVSGMNIDDFMVDSKIQKLWFSSKGSVYEISL